MIECLHVYRNVHKRMETLRHDWSRELFHLLDKGTTHLCRIHETGLGLGAVTGEEVAGRQG